ncbi:caspase-6 [Octopus bimaculoides]|uniref:caspase-6 n=1 Tax=Octopus bimaculoides TaxID=37653 RepID=UPI00071CB1B6|nr:caspase-6 [Octopus bimaculoides]|eukprot:XP_014774631.1 PREDICTED: caspase-6-like [Octopus bimaculoides]
MAAEEDVMGFYSYYDPMPTKNSFAHIFSNANFANNGTRDASSQDKDLLKQALIRLGFLADNITEYTDMSTSEISKFDEVFQDRDVDCFVCAFLSYMHPGNYIRTYDSVISLNEILRKVPSLKGKPKLIFVVTTPCSKDENAIEKCDADRFGFEEEHTIPRTADMLIVCASDNNSTRSSYFMQFLKQVLEEYGNTYDIMTILAAVSNCIKEETRGREQIPYIMSTLTKQLKFERN